ncbi:MAG: Uma2 family endonuclease [Tepidisphaeraceae bacterium]|jgi:Uma2 family endonuclease
MPATLRKPRVIGPEHNGRRMSLDDFDRAISRDGQIFELNKGVIEMTDVPHHRHFAQLQAARNQLVIYQDANPETIHSITGGMESKILVAATQSERHPDLSVYLSPPPDVEDVWSLWVPAIVIEIVSPSSANRDYHEKPDDYLEFGISEYWIIDAQKQQMTAMIRWRGLWKPKIAKANQKYTTRQLPGFSLNLSKVFAAAK